MSIELTDDMTAYLAGLDKPANGVATPETRQAFYEAVVRIGSYRGDPEPLYEAALMLEKGTPAALFHAGVAMVLTASCYVSNGEHDVRGLEHVTGALDTAKHYAPDATEVLFAEAYVALRFQQLERAGDKIKMLLEREPENTHFLTLQLGLLAQRKVLVAAVGLYRQIQRLPMGEEQRVNLLNAIAGHCLTLGAYTDATEMYHEVIRLRPQDPWAWHNQSIIYLRQRKLIRAYRYNKAALGIMRFGAAESVRRTLLKKRSEWVFWFTVCVVVVALGLAANPQ